MKRNVLLTLIATGSLLMAGCEKQVKLPPRKC